MSRRNFPVAGSNWTFEFRTWIGGETRSLTWCSNRLQMTDQQRATIGSIIVVGKTPSKPTSGSFDMFAVYKDPSGEILYPGSRASMGFADIALANDFGLNGTSQLGFSLVFTLPQPSRCDGFVFYNGLDVSVLNIQAAYVPYVTLVSDVNMGE